MSKRENKSLPIVYVDKICHKPSDLCTDRNSWFDFIVTGLNGECPTLWQIQEWKWQFHFHFLQLGHLYRVFLNNVMQTRTLAWTLESKYNCYFRWFIFNSSIWLENVYKLDYITSYSSDIFHLLCVHLSTFFTL